ncbi:alpha/beta-hydrolase [Xylariomycetidae sp. FL0641]|nr:alpha/beta-hydrolase [Xylariomycetidae sp. FL0641]
MADFATESQAAQARKQKQLPLLSRLYNGATATVLRGALNTLWLCQDWYRWYYNPDTLPNIVKSYDDPPGLPVRIFFPKSYDQTSPLALPTFFTIHGGGFAYGLASNIDDFNFRFANMHHVLVISLSYRKAPYYPFPTAIHDLEALLLAVHGDESLPIDKTRIAVGGFSAGGNLALAVCQLPSIREKIRMAAAVPLYAVLDHSVSPEEKCRMRYYKPGLAPGMRAQTTDAIAGLAHMFNWGYIPVGQDLEDPLLSPAFAARDALPPHLFVINAELDQLAHEGWRTACKMAGRPVPAFTDKVGQEKPAETKGQLILDDERFAFEQVSEDGKSSVRWLLVPDQVHGFDQLLTEGQHGGEESRRDAEMKTEATLKVIGDWLHGVAWKGIPTA